MKILSRLRLFFIIYFIVKLIIDIAAGSRIISEQDSFLYISPEMLYTFAIIGNIFLFLFGLLLFYFLIEKRNWARIVLLIIGWLAVLDFFSSLIFSSRALKFLSHIDHYINWDTLILIDRVTDFVALIFWGYAIYILQFNAEVQKIFVPDNKEKNLNNIQQ
jgi:hypothetical protein